MHKSDKELKGIIFFNQTLAMGGAEIFSNQLLTWFKNRNVPVYAWTTYPPQVKNLEKLGIKTKRIPIVVDIIGDWKGFIKGVILLPFAFFYYGYLTYINRKMGTILMSGSEKLLVTPWAKLFKIPVVWIEHGPLEDLFSKFFGLFKVLYKLSSKYPNFVVEPTKYVVRKNKYIAGFKPDKTRVIPSGINPLKSIASAKLRYTAYSASRMEHGKGQDLLISAWQKVIEKIPAAHLYLLGEGETKKELQLQVSQLKLSKSVTFLGWVDNDKLAKTIAPFTVGVFPSVWPLESFGVSVVEAMSLGKPVICFNYGPYPEVVGSDCGILVKKGDVGELSNAIINVFSNPEEEKKLGLNGTKRFIDYFSMDKVGQMYYDTLQESQNDN